MQAGIITDQVSLLPPLRALLLSEVPDDGLYVLDTGRALLMLVGEQLDGQMLSDVFETVPDQSGKADSYKVFWMLEVYVHGANIGLCSTGCLIFSVCLIYMHINEQTFVYFVFSATITTVYTRATRSILFTRQHRGMKPFTISYLYCNFIVILFVFVK